MKETYIVSYIKSYSFYAHWFNDPKEVADWINANAMHPNKTLEIRELDAVSKTDTLLEPYYYELLEDGIVYNIEHLCNNDELFLRGENIIWAKSVKDAVEKLENNI